MSTLPEVPCKNCPQTVTRLASGIWVDGAGFTYCKKQLDGEAPMLHEPRPGQPLRLAEGTGDRESHQTDT